MKAKRVVKIAKKSKSKSKNSLLTWFLGASLLITAAFVLLRNYYPPATANIFVVDQPALTYGDTVVTGVLGRTEDAFILDLGNNVLVRLDIKGIEYLLGQTISAFGYLEMDIHGNNLMQVREIEVSTL